MSRISRLKSQSKNLQKQINQIQLDMNNRLRNYQRSTDARIKQLNSQMKEALAKHDAETESRYYKLLNNFQRDIVSNHNKEMNKLIKEYNALKKQLHEVNKELEEESNKIKKEINDIKQDIENERKNNQKTSNENISSLLKIYNKVAELPHETFFPNKFNTYENYIISAKELHLKHMYNSSVALASSGKVMLELFQCDIENKSEEWKIAFINYCNQAELVKKLISSSENRMYKYSDFNYNLTDEKQFDYWSNREYSGIVLKLKQHLDLINDIKKQGIENYIKSTDNPISIDEFEMRINELSYIMHQYNKICEFSLINIQSFHTRTIMKDIIINCMEDSYNLFVSDEYFDSSANGNQNYDDYKYMYRNYIEKEAYSVRNPDYRERYVIKMRNDGADIYNFYIVPESVNTVVNALNTFNINLINTVYYEVVPKQVGTDSALDNIYDEIQNIINGIFLTSSIKNYQFVPVRDISDREKLSRARVKFSSELSDDEKVIIRNNNMTWQTESQ